MSIEKNLIKELTLTHQQPSMAYLNAYKKAQTKEEQEKIKKIYNALKKQKKELKKWN